MWLIVWAYVHSQMNSQTCTKFGANRSSRLTASQTFECVTPYPPPRHAPWGIEGWLVFSLCPFPDESADMRQSWCQSVQPFDSSPDCWIFDPLNPPPKCPLLSLRAMCLAYIHSQMNMHMCTKFVANRNSRLTSSPDFWICDPLSPPMSSGELYLAYVHSQTNPQTYTKFGVKDMLSACKNWIIYILAGLPGFARHSCSKIIFIIAFYF